MASFDITGDFSKAALGKFTLEQKQKAWGGLVTEDFDEAGNKYSIVEDGRFAGGRACRCRYPRGEVGMNDQSYQIRIKSPKCPVALEFDWLFESPFQFYSADQPASANGGGGKLGPCINWGEIGGATEKRGTRAMPWWNAYGSMKSKPCFNPSCQDQRSGDQLVQPVVYWGSPLELDRIYRWKIEIMGGPPPQSYAKYWIDGELIAHVHDKLLQVTADDDVIIDFAYFAGGPIESAPTVDQYGRMGSIRYYSVGAAENPGTEGVTVVIDGVSYAASGELKLRRQ